MAHIEGFGGRGGLGRRPALAVIDMTLVFTDPESPLACDLKGPISEIQNPDAHKANLYDIDAKYGDVVSVQEVLDQLEVVAAAHAR